MVEPFSSPLPPLRRIVTFHDSNGNSIIQADTKLPSEVSSPLHAVYGLLICLAGNGTC